MWYEVDPVVCDYGVYECNNDGSKELRIICNELCNARLIAKIANTDLNKVWSKIPTNGDVMKAMFPKIDFHEMSFTVHATTKVTSNGVKGGISYDFWKSWWDAPYKAESEEE